ncbi:unnamed protein product, partial [Effrenium voratum]
MRIKRLDLAYNEFDWTPSQLSQALEAMGHLRGLQNLRLYHNKFVACFKEYQIYVVSRLVSLQKLDDCMITMQMREDIAATNLLALDVYDVAFKKRQEELARRRDDSGPKTHGGVGKLKLIMESLEEVLEDPEALASRVALVRDNAAKRAQGSSAFHIEEAFWDGMDTGSPAEMQITVSYIMELITAVMERHDTARGQLVDTLGFLSCVVAFDLGRKCLDHLRRMMLSSDHCREEASRGMKGIVVPTVMAFGEANIKSDVTKTILLGLLDMVQEMQIREEVCDIMEELLPLMLTFFLTEEYLTEEISHIVQLLAFGTGPEEYAQLAATPELAARCIMHLENKSLFDSPRLRTTWMDVLKISQNIAAHGSEEIVEMFSKAAIHSKVVARLRQVLTATKGRHNDVPLAAKTIASICHFVSAIMKRSNVALQECCDPICLHDVLCQLLRSHVVDPLIMEAVTQTLRVMLEDPKVYKKQGIKVVEDLRKVTPLLQFLGGKKYPELYKLAMKHNEESDNADAPPFGELENDLVTNAMVGIVSLVEFFAAEDDSIEDDQARQLVNDAMNIQGRETILLKLLVIPNDDLKLIVMRCLSKVPLSQIEPDEMGAIVKCLSDVKNIGEGRTEEMLALVVRQLQRLLLAPGETGQQFRSGFAERAVAECSEILLANSQRSTSRESDELEKLALSSAIVSFYFNCSGIHSLRSCLRNPTIDALFPRIMKLEEELHSPLAEDVSLEQTWMGRSLENLLQCFQGGRQLFRNKKVAIRVLCQMGNVLEGRSSYHGRRRKMLSLQELVGAEAKMWDLRAVKKGQRFLDNQEWDDRIAQASNFVGAGGPGRLQEFLLDLAAKEREEYYLDQYGKVSERPDVILLEAEALKTELAERSQAWGEEEAQQVAMGEDDENEYHKSAGREVLMIAMQREEEELEDDQSALFALRPDSLAWDEEVFHDLKKGQTNLVFAAAAYLRIVHALLVLPPQPALRRMMLQELRRPECLAKLLALVAGLPALSCHVAAKFLRVMSSALSLSDDGDADPPKLEHFSMVAMYIQRLAESLLFLLKLSKDQRLEPKEEVLSVEIARFVGTMAAAAPRLSKVNLKFPGQPDIQKFCIEKILNWLVPSAAIRVFVAMVQYELQLDSGKTLHQEFVKDAYTRVGMKDQALAALSQILVRCAEYRYDVLEVFSVAEVFLSQNVRPSFLGELLNNLNLGSFTLFVEQFLAEYDLESQDQRVLHMEIVDVHRSTSKKFAVCLFVATNYKAYLLEPSCERPAYAGDVGDMWEPNMETLFPREPQVIWEREYSTLVRIWHCCGDQILALEWKGAGKTLYETDAAEDNKIQCEVYLFHQADRRDAVAECLRANAAKGSDVGPPVLADTSFREGIVSESKEEQLLAVTVATMGPAPRVGLFAAEQKADPTPRLFALTTSTVLEFTIISSAWQPPTQLDSAIFDDLTPADLEDDAAADEGEEEEELPPPTEEEMALRHLERICGTQKLPEPHAARPVLSLVKKHKLPPSE